MFNIGDQIRTIDNDFITECNADTVDDLPGAEDIALYRMALGSTCLIVGTGEVYALDSEGTWVQL